MSYRLVVKEGARIDAESAYLYYEEQQAGLGERFLEALQKRFSEISEQPQYYSYIDTKKLLRDVAVPHFPYVVIFAIIEEEVRVYAIHLTHKKAVEF